MGVANQTPGSTASDYATIQFVVQQLLSRMATATLVRVQKCTNAGGVEPVGKVDVQLLVDQVTEDGQTIPHGTVFNAPYLRIQGGTNAIILDPQPGDIGLCVFAMRDISSVKSDPDAARNRAPVPGAPPGSKRTYSYSDALYVGGMLNGAPTQYVQFTDAGIVVKSPQAITLQAPTITLDGDVHVTGTTTMDGAATAQGTNVHTHTHSGVTPGGGNSGPPV